MRGRRRGRVWTCCLRKAGVSRRRVSVIHLGQAFLGIDAFSMNSFAIRTTGMMRAPVLNR